MHIRLGIAPSTLLFQHVTPEEDASEYVICPGEGELLEKCWRISEEDEAMPSMRWKECSKSENTNAQSKDGTMCIDLPGLSFMEEKMTHTPVG